MMGIRAV